MSKPNCLIRGICLRFHQMQVGALFRTRDADLKTKN